MGLRGHRTACRMLLVVLGVAVILSVANPTLGGPYLLNWIEMSPAAGSQGGCNGQVVSVLRNLQKEERRLSVQGRHGRRAMTENSTMVVDCIFVGRNQWIFYISIASTDSPELKHLEKLLQEKFRAIEPFD